MGHREDARAEFDRVLRESDEILAGLMAAGQDVPSYRWKTAPITQERIDDPAARRSDEFEAIARTLRISPPDF